MKKILLQQSQSALLDPTLRHLENHYQIIAVFDNEMGTALLKNEKDITAIVIFELTENALKVAKLARNERFCDPTIPIAYVGNESSTKPMPYGCTRFDEETIIQLSEFLDIQLSIRALIVEDDEALRDITATTLSKNMEVETASNGDDAYRMLQNNIYDVVVLDVMLPGMSGEDIFKFMTDKFEETPIVIITAHDTNEREFHFNYSDAAGYIKKPFESNKIFRHQVMNSIVEHHEKIAQRRLVISNSERDIALEQYKKSMSRYL